jgi:YesN/AraC family two-component response regulator
MVFTWIDRQPLYIYKVRAYFMLILHRFFELIMYNADSSINDTRIKKITRHISSHYADKISVQKMAAMIGLNPVYLGSLFKQETGMTLNQYLIKTRIRTAENLLQSGEYKVSEVADRCGYCDIYHFYKQFKQVCGISPSGYIPKKSLFVPKGFNTQEGACEEEL